MYNNLLTYIWCFAGLDPPLGPVLDVDLSQLLRVISL